MLVRRVHVLLAVTAVATGTAAGVSAAGAASKTRTVKVTDDGYSPRKMTVRSGTKVVWSFSGSLPHNVEVTRGPELFSSTIVKKGTFSRRLRRRGTYRIVCSLHTYMTQKVIVR